MKSFVLHLTFEDAYECMVGQINNGSPEGHMFHDTRDNYDFEFYKKPKDTGWYKVPFRKPRVREFTRNELNGMFNVSIDGTWQNTTYEWIGETQRVGQSWTAQVQDVQQNLGRPTVTNVHTTPGDVVFRNGSTITNHVREMERTASRVTVPGGLGFTDDHMEHIRQHTLLQDRINRQAQEEALARSMRANQDERERREAQREAERQRLEAERNRPSFLRRINPFR